MVQAAIGENNRELLQATLVDMVVRQFHGGLLWFHFAGQISGFSVAGCTKSDAKAGPLLPNSPWRRRDSVVGHENFSA
jgi:hypothetical protein